MDMVYSVSSAERYNNNNKKIISMLVYFSIVLVTLWLVFCVCPFSWGIVPTRLTAVL